MYALKGLYVIYIERECEILPWSAHSEQLNLRKVDRGPARNCTVTAVYTSCRPSCRQK